MADDIDNLAVKDTETVPAPSPAPDPAPEAAPAENAPVQSDPDATGGQPADTEGKPASESEEQTQPKPEGKKALPGVQRDISKLRAERRELRERTRQLEAQLAKQMGNPLAGLIQGQVKPEETATYWKQQALQAQTEEQRTAASQKYWELLPTEIQRNAVGQVLQTLNQVQENQRIAGKLAEIHERTPIFDENGTPDANSPVIQRACELADQQGVMMFGPKGAIVNHRAFEYFAREASWELQGQTAETNAAKLQNQRVQTLKASAKAGLESSSAPAPAQPSGKTVDLEKQISALEKQRNTGRYDPELNVRLMKLRRDLHDARLRTAATR